MLLAAWASMQAAQRAGASERASEARDPCPAIAMIALVLESPVIIIIIPGYAASRIRSVYNTAGSDTTIAAVFWRIMQD